MIEIQESGTIRFPTDWFFVRTDRLRSKIEDCSREELIDLTSHLMTEFTKIQGDMETVNLRMENVLGFHDPMTNGWVEKQ